MFPVIFPEYEYAARDDIGVFSLLILSRMMCIQRFVPDLDEFPISEIFKGEE